MNTDKTLNPDKTLNQFNYWKNVEPDTTINEVVAEFNKTHPEKMISAEDVKFGPNFRKIENTYHQLTKTGFHFSYSHCGHHQMKIACNRGHKFPKGVFIYDEKSRAENLAEVLEIIEKEDYLDQFSIISSSRNEHEGFLVDVIRQIKYVSAGRGWKFKQSAEDSNKNLGELEAEGFTYRVAEEYTSRPTSCPSSLTLYDKEGRRLDLSEDDIQSSRHREVLNLLGESILADLKKQEDEYYEQYGGE